MVARRLRLGSAVWLCAVTCLVVFWGASAGAAVTHEYLSQITEVPAVGPHGEAVPVPGAISEGDIDSLTTDEGKVWLSEHIRGAQLYRTDEFDAASGAFLSQLSQVSGVTHLDQGVAVGHATGEANVYVTGYDEASRKGVVLVFGEDGSLIGRWTGADTSTGAFGCFSCGEEKSLVAVDGSQSLGDWAAGDVYVADPENKAIDVFDAESKGKEKLAAEPITGISPSNPFSRPEDVAVSSFNGDVLVVDNSEVDIFRPAPISGQYEYVTTLSGSSDGPLGGIQDIAVDGASGDIYVAGQHVVYEFDSSGAYLGRIEGGKSPAGEFRSVNSIAIDASTDHVFIADYSQFTGTYLDIFGPDFVIPDVSTNPASSVQPERAGLSGTVNPDGAGEATCQFVWGTTTAFGQVAPCLTPIANGSSPVAVEASLSGLQPDTTYYFRLQASNAHGANVGEAVQDQQFTTPGPGLHGESASDVTSSSASFAATINPHNAATTYYFQYGTSGAYGSEIPASPGGVVGSGEADVEVSRHVQGLAAGTVYHYRVVAVSELAPGVLESFPAPDQTLTTQAASGGGPVLADGRSWEMVSPPAKHGAQIYAIGMYSDEGAVIQASASGDAITYVTDSPTEASPAGYTNLLQVFSGRGAAGWTSGDISIEHGESTGISIGYGQEYRAFSEDLSLGVIQPFGKFVPSLSAEASEPTAYLRSDYGSGGPADPCVNSCFHPLVTSAPGYANVPEGTVFGQEVEGKCHSAEGAVLCGPHFVGATPDLSHVVLKSTVSLTSTPAPHGGLYEWNGGHLVLVSVLPRSSGEAVAATLGSSNVDAHHAISEDGSRIFWTAGSGLYMRDVPREETILIGGPGGFEDASADGSVVFFGGEKCEVKVDEATGELECPVVGAGEKVIGTSKDGSWVYFVSSAVLAQGGVSGANNVYVSHGGVTRFIGAVSAEDAQRMASSDISELTSRVSANGRWLVFMSRGELTGASTRDAVSGQADEEVYLYDALASGGAGRLVCASCAPSGARPVGTEYPSEDTLWGGDRVWDHAWVASNIPGGTPYALATALYQSRVLSDSGRVFFNSEDGLVPQDVNGTWDVYEYEPPGVGDCSTASTTFSERSGGCVGLVSSGESGEESGFLDASEDGSDVFFLTSAKLVGQDNDTALDIYDAHECSPGAPCFASPPVSPPPCDTGDSCKAAPSPQPTAFGAPASATFVGVGNVSSPAAKAVVVSKGLSRARKLARALQVCRKKKDAKRRARCMKQARSRYGAKRATVTATKRGGR
jgi:hypothetical protein